MYLWIVFALISAVFFSAKDLIAKKLFVKDHINHKHIVMHEYIFYLIVLLFFIPSIDFTSFVTYWYLYLFKAVSVGTAGFVYFRLLAKHSITTVAPLTNLSPLLLLLFSLVILGEMVSTLQIIGILIMVVATYYLEIVLQHHHRVKCVGCHWYTIRKQEARFFIAVLVMLAAFSLAAVADKLVLAQVNIQTNVFFTAVLVLIILATYYKPKSIIESVKQYKTTPQTILFASINTLSTLFVLLAIAIPTALVSLIIPLRRSATLFSALFGGLMFHEDHVVKKVLAVLLMIIGVFLMVI